MWLWGPGVTLTPAPCIAGQGPQDWVNWNLSHLALWMLPYKRHLRFICFFYKIKVHESYLRLFINQWKGSELSRVARNPQRPSFIALNPSILHAFAGVVVTAQSSKIFGWLSTFIGFSRAINYSRSCIIFILVSLLSALFWPFATSMKAVFSPLQLILFPVIYSCKS